MPTAKKKKNAAGKYNFEGKDLEYYNALMEARAAVSSQMRYHAESLDRSNSDKRGVTTHMADVASDNAHHEMELRMLTEDGDVLQLIDDAIKRLINGEYGKCQECGEMIAEGRLKVRPYAVFCIKCKTQREKMAKMF
jgi:DnaK suppressor protein